MKIHSSVYYLVIRGGTWSYPLSDLEAAIQFKYIPPARQGILGFRLVRKS